MAVLTSSPILLYCLPSLLIASLSVLPRIYDVSIITGMAFNIKEYAWSHALEFLEQIGLFIYTFFQSTVSGLE